MARKKRIASRKLTKRQMVLAEKDQNKEKASNSHPMKQHNRHLAQMTSEIPPSGSSAAISRPTDPFARTSDVIPPPSLQGIHSTHTSRPTIPDAGHTIDIFPKKGSAIPKEFVRPQMASAEKYQNKGNDYNGHPRKQRTTGPVKMTSQIPPCASSHAISRPTDPFARTSVVRDPPLIQGVHSPRSSQPTSDAGRTLKSFVPLETQINDGKPIIYLSGKGFLPSRPAANEIGDILKSHYSDPWPSWKKIPISTTDLWFEEFLRKFSICPPDYVWAKKNFEIQGAAMMKSILNEARTTMSKPDWVKDDVWERLCEHWKSEELKKKIAQAEKNREHQREDNTWVDIQEEFTQTLEQLTKSAFAQGNPPPSEADVWHVVRKKKGMAGGSCYHGSSSSMEWVKRQDFDVLRKNMKEMKDETEKLQSRVANVERLAEHNNALIRELMETMNKPSTVDESQDEDGSN